MFKFVAVVAFLAVAAASPDPALISTVPLAYSAGFAPAVTAYSAASHIYNPAPVVYSSPALAYPGNYGYAHYIKKRSVPVVSSYFASAPLATTYSAAPFAATYAGAPLATTYASAPLGSTYTTYGSSLVHASPVYSTPHFIKKRAAPLIFPSTSYIAPTAYSSAPLVSAYSAYSAAAPIYSSPYYSTAPLAYTQFIKK
ncbi:pupal cuticle protein G1A [Pieris rapae]|uniref:pupal cuticle protein G1A n=1 Tax=Pieris rapae TaxID=64459 RepID=UPI001E280F6E|nr:pupal cuticle protein G1A [Pieris rapae]